MSNWTYSPGNTGLALPYSRGINGVSSATWTQLTASAASDYCAVDVSTWFGATSRFKFGFGASSAEVDATPLIQATGDKLALIRVPLTVRQGTRVSIWIESGATYLGCNFITGTGAMDAGYATATPLNATPISATTSWVQVSASTAVPALGLLLIYPGMSAGSTGDIGVGTTGSQVVIGNFYNSYNGTYTAWLGQPVPAGSNLWVRLDGGTANFTACALA